MTFAQSLTAALFTFVFVFTVMAALYGLIKLFSLAISAMEKRGKKNDC